MSIAVRNRLLLTAGLALAFAAGCTKSTTKTPTSLGKPLAKTPARALATSPDGALVAFVGEVKPPPERNAPEGIFQGVLTTVPVEGGTPRRLGGGVPTLEHGYLFSPDGRYIAWLQGFRFADQSGTLQIAANPQGEPRQIAEKTRFYRFSPDGKLLGYVADGQMRLVDLETFADRLITTDAATFEFSRDSDSLLVRRTLASGGELLLAKTEGKEEPQKLGERVGEYAFTPDGAAIAFTAREGGPQDPYLLFLRPVAGGKARKVGEGVSSFFFSPDGRYIAFIDGVKVSRPFGDLQVAAIAGGATRKLGENVVDVKWAPSSTAIGFRENHEDPAGRKRVTFKYAQMPDGAVKQVDDGVSSFLWSDDGRHFAYLQRVTKPVFSVDLFVREVGEETSVRIDKGVFGYQFSPSGREVWYRAGCIREGRECDLRSQKVDGGEGTVPTIMLQGIWTFSLSKDGQRMLVSFPRIDTEAAGDLGYYSPFEPKPTRGIDKYALPGAQFVGPNGDKLVYIVAERNREGVYVAELE